jgi:anthranilate synthase component 1
MVRELSEGMVPAGKEGPLARFMLCTQGIVFDHARDSCILFDDLILNGETDCRKEHARARQRLEKLEEKIRRISAERTTDRAHIPRASSPPVSSVSREAYQEAVRKALEYIHAGDIFQVVLSRKITCHVREDPLDIYGAIRTINPSPYLYYLQFGDEAIIGSSPEMLVKVEGKSVQTVPIAGTRPRGNSVAEDTKLAAELLADPKERAEHLMLVDLARNDIGKISDFGSVNVPEYMEVEKFSHVQHIVSRVCGTLREDRDRFDAFASCFPAGTVSGAPKIRAMQIIAELETQPRGLYAGAVGYAGFSNDLEFAIAIRTLRFRRGFVEFSTGAGIVADSIPEREFEETEYKAGAMMKAIGIVGVTG